MKNFTLYDELNDLIRSTNWIYYRISTAIDINILADTVGAKDFIRNYIGKGGKLTQTIDTEIEGLSDQRLLHMLSCFFWGYYLYKNLASLQKHINDSVYHLNDNPNETLEERFAYIWFLICFFHDLGYAYENNAMTVTLSEYKELYKEFPRRPKGIPVVYTKELLDNYNKYRKCRWGCVDHGIIGGFKQHKELCRLRKIKNGEETDSDGSCEKDYSKEHYWGKSLEDAFALSAWVIACHNIYMIGPKDKNVECYHCCELDKLIDAGKPIDLKKHPLLFLLCLADSIEPMKILHSVEEFKKITIEFSEDMLSINAKDLCPAKHDAYISAIIDIGNWLTDSNSFNISM